jgi:hypothetical protein
MRLTCRLFLDLFSEQPSVIIILKFIEALLIIKLIGCLDLRHSRTFGHLLFIGAHSYTWWHTSAVERNDSLSFPTTATRIRIVLNVIG